MRTQTALHIVQKPLTPPCDDTKGLKAIAGFKAKLLAASVRYIVEAKDGSMNDRLRTASNLSGITRDALVVAVKSQG